MGSTKESSKRTCNIYGKKDNWPAADVFFSEQTLASSDVDVTALKVDGDIRQQ